MCIILRWFGSLGILLATSVVPAHGAVQSPTPCGTPSTVPDPAVTVEAAASHDGSGTIQLRLTTTGSSFSDLSNIEFVPEEGSVTEVTLPSSAIKTAGNTLTLSIPKRSFRLNDYRVVVDLRSEDPSSLGCAHDRKIVIGSIPRALIYSMGP